MNKPPVAILGVSFDNLTLEEFAQRALWLINLHMHDGLPRYICTVNVDFLAKVHSLNWNRLKDKELMDIYRSSALVACDGKPLVWLSRLLGSPLQERVTGTDILPKMAAVCAQNGKSIYLLGGTEQLSKVTALVLEALSPGLKIAGRLSPVVCTEGENLLHIVEHDALIVGEISRAAPDFLCIGLGNPKQEKWFERVKAQLRVPLSIGVGGSFDILAGALKRAPRWMQQAGLEWFYRLLQEPGRLWKRYLRDMGTFLGIAVPLLCFHTISRFLYWARFSPKESRVESPLLFLSSSQTIAVVPLPALMGEEYVHIAYSYLEEAFIQDTVILDFENVRHITLEGFSLLMQIWQKAQSKCLELYGINISGDIKMLMKVHRIWDLVRDNVMDSPQHILHALIQRRDHADFFDSVQQNDDHVVIYFFGRVGSSQNQLDYIEKLVPLLTERNCVLDFRYCAQIENSGFSFLLKVKKIVESRQHQLFVRKRNPYIRRLFQMSQLDGVFKDYKGEP